MELALILLIPYGAKDFGPIELERYPSDYGTNGCYEAAKSLSDKSIDTARMYVLGSPYEVGPAYVCVPVPKKSES